MGELISLHTAQRKRDERVRDLWDAYLKARDKAERSRDIADGMAAGKAWAAWLDSFTAVSA